MFTFKTCQPVPMRGGRGGNGGGGEGVGLVKVKGKVVWGGQGGVYVLNDTNSKWEKMAYGIRYGATLAVYGGELISVGGCLKDFVEIGHPGQANPDHKGDGSDEVMVCSLGGRWTSMTNMLVGCWGSCVISISGGGLVVMGGGGGDGNMLRNDIQVFDGKTWHFGPPLPGVCWDMSAVVHGDQVFVMGGWGAIIQAVWSANITDLVSH